MPSVKKVCEPTWRGYPVQASADKPLRLDILEGLDKRLGSVLDSCGSVVVQRCDLHFSNGCLYRDGNETVQDFMMNLSRWIRSRGIVMHSIWVHEQEDGTPHHHYHCAFLLDGRSRIGTDTFMCAVRHCWCLALNRPDAEGLNLVYECRERRIDEFLRSGDVVQQGDVASINQCFYWLSYLAKCRTKESCPEYTRTFSCSSLGVRV